MSFVENVLVLLVAFCAFIGLWGILELLAAAFGFMEEPCNTKKKD